MGKGIWRGMYREILNESKMEGGWKETKPGRAKEELGKEWVSLSGVCVKERLEGEEVEVKVGEIRGKFEDGKQVGDALWK